MTFNNKIGKVEIAVFMCLVFLIAGELYIVLWTAVINSSNMCVCVCQSGLRSPRQNFSCLS